MPDKFKSISDIINKDKAFENFRKSVQEQNVVEDFATIFPDLCKTVSASNVHKRVLYLIVENSVLRNELYLKKDLVIGKINNHFNQQVIVDVKFTNFRNIHRKTT